MERDDTKNDLFCHETMPVLRAWTDEDTKKFIEEIHRVPTDEELASLTVKACRINAYVNGDNYGYMTVNHPLHRQAIFRMLKALNFDVDVYGEGDEISIGINFGGPDNDSDDQEAEAPSPVVGAKRVREGKDDDEDEDNDLAKSIKDSDDDDDKSTVVCEN